MVGAILVGFLHIFVSTGYPPGGGYFGLRSYGDVPSFRVHFLTQNILDRVQI